MSENKQNVLPFIKRRKRIAPPESPGARFIEGLEQGLENEWLDRELIERALENLQTGHDSIDIFAAQFGPDYVHPPGEPATVAELIGCLHDAIDDEEPDTARAIMERLMMADCGGSANAVTCKLLETSGRPWEPARIAAVRAIGRWGTPELGDDLCAALQGDPASEVRLAAAVALAKLLQRHKLLLIELAASWKAHPRETRLLYAIAMAPFYPDALDHLLKLIEKTDSARSAPAANKAIQGLWCVFRDEDEVS